MRLTRHIHQHQQSGPLALAYQLLFTPQEQGRPRLWRGGGVSLGLCRSPPSFISPHLCAVSRPCSFSPSSRARSSSINLSVEVWAVKLGSSVSMLDADGFDSARDGGFARPCSCTCPSFSTLRPFTCPKLPYLCRFPLFQLFLTPSISVTTMYSTSPSNGQTAPVNSAVTPLPQNTTPST